MYRFQTLQDVNLQQLADCFNLAFSDYEQPIRFSVKSLQYYLTASAVNLSLSCGAFWQDELVGFILNSSGVYHEQAVVFDAGTGIVPAHRGKKVFSALFDYTCLQLQHRGIAKYYLEVLQSNHHAQTIYQKKGFSVQRAYSVLTASGPSGSDSGISLSPLEDFAAFPTSVSVAPSYEHTTYTVQQNHQLYEVLYLPGQAYCIYAKRNGELIQLHYNDPDALAKVLCALTHRHPSAMAKNIDFDYADVIQILQSIGFREITRQYEMARDI